MSVPGPHFPDASHPRSQRLAPVDDVHASVGLHLAAVPEIGPARVELIGRGGNEDLVCGLFLAALIGRERPTESRLDDIDPQRVDQVFASQLVDGHSVANGRASVTCDQSHSHQSCYDRPVHAKGSPLFK